MRWDLKLHRWGFCRHVEHGSEVPWLRCRWLLFVFLELSFAWRIYTLEVGNRWAAQFKRFRFTKYEVSMFNALHVNVWYVFFAFFGPLYLQYCLETMSFRYFPPGVISRSKSWCSWCCLSISQTTPFEHVSSNLIQSHNWWITFLWK